MPEVSSGICVTVGLYVIPTYKTYNDYEKLWVQAPYKWRELTDLQRRLDPNLAKFRDAVIIAPGDTLSSREERMKAYLLPIFRNVIPGPRPIPNPQESEQYSVPSSGRSAVSQQVSPQKQATGAIPKPVPNSYEGPKAIIVCKSTSTCYEVDKVMKTINSRGIAGYPEIQFGFRGKLPKKLINDPTKTPMKHDVVVTTLQTFQWMLKTYRSKLVASLRFLVCEELESYSGLDWDHLNDAIKTGNHFCPRKFTMTMVSAKWSLPLENFYTNFLKERRFVSIYFTDLIQFLKFVGPKVNLRFYENDSEKNLVLIEMLNKGDLKERQGIVVACRPASVDIVDRIVTKYTLFKSSRQTSTEGDVAIVSDDKSQKELKAESFQVFVSFDGARLRQLRYLRRCQPSWYQEGNKEVMKRCPLEVTFLMDGKEQDFLQVYKATKELNGTIDGHLEEEGKMLLEEETRGKMLCTGILLYGYCDQVTSGRCGDRHEFRVEDVAPEPIVHCIGEIEFKVLSCTNPTLYRSVILRYFRKVKGKKIIVRDFSEEIRMYRQHLNRLWPTLQLTRVENFVKGVKYIAKETWKANRQAKFIPVLLMKFESGPNKSYLCKVASLETGEVHETSGNFLWDCPSEKTFGELPDNATNIIYGNVSPPYGEREYGLTDLTKAADLTEGKEKPFTGTIGMSLREFIWLKSIRDDTGKELKHQFPPQIRNNPNHLKGLISHVKNFGSAYPCHKLLSFDDTQAAAHPDFHTKNDGFVWRHLEINEEPVTMKIRYVYDPSLFYGEYLKFNGLLKRLDRDLQTWAGRNLYNDLNVNEIKFFDELEIDDVIAVNAGTASSPSWIRALIWDKKGSIQKGFLFDVISVDNGDFIYEVGQQDCRPIRKDLVTRLPFQAVAMKLSNASPVEEQWSEEACDYFSNLMIPEETGCTVAVVATEELYDDEVPSKYYGVVAVDREINDISAHLVDRKLAIYTPDTDFTDSLNLLKRSVINIKTDGSLNDSGLSSSDHDGWDSDDRSPERNSQFHFDADDFDVIVPPKEKAVNAEHSKPKTTKAAVKKKVLKKVPRKLLSSSSKEDGAKALAKFKYSPTVLHHETLDEVVFTVQLSDISEYKIEPEDKPSRTICVSITTPEDYGFELTLYGKVRPNPGTTKTGQNLVVKYKKVLSQKWPKLLQDNLKYRWLKSDYNQISEESSADEETVSDDTLTGVISAADDSSDDEDIVFKTNSQPLPNPDDDFSWM